MRVVLVPHRQPLFLDSVLQLSRFKVRCSLFEADVEVGGEIVGFHVLPHLDHILNLLFSQVGRAGNANLLSGQGTNVIGELVGAAEPVEGIFNDGAD